MIDKGRIAFDGDFARLRRQLGATRHLLIETSSPAAPVLQGASHVGSVGNWHEYRFDASRTGIPALLDQAAATATVVDVETHQAPIDTVIAGLYEQWREPEKG
jgi:ABC-type uncharacterized transport system ATPase subunit